MSRGKNKINFSDRHSTEPQRLACGNVSCQRQRWTEHKQVSECRAHCSPAHRYVNHLHALQVCQSSTCTAYMSIICLYCRYVNHLPVNHLPVLQLCQSSACIAGMSIIYLHCRYVNHLPVLQVCQSSTCIAGMSVIYLYCRYVNHLPALQVHCTLSAVICIVRW